MYGLYILLAFVGILLITSYRDGSHPIANSALKESPEVGMGIDPKDIGDSLSKIVLLVFDGLLTTEVTPSMDVFAKKSVEGTQLFNVFTIAESKEAFRSEEGLAMIPDFTCTHH